ncbi:MAG: hypothetical protein TV42_04905 [Wolbachia endosymbiont of Dactylopius coccus]|nr:MAG: hypothetical protein TV42_04905 [Wolbachia endosymbiont of Dactylopius coccus]
MYRFYAVQYSKSQHQARESRRFGTTYRSALFESSIIGIFVVFYAVKSIDSFAAVFMGFTAVVVKDDLKVHPKPKVRF